MLSNIQQTIKNVEGEPGEQPRLCAVLWVRKKWGWYYMVFEWISHNQLNSACKYAKWRKEIVQRGKPEAVKGKKIWVNSFLLVQLGKVDLKLGDSRGKLEFSKK